MDRRRLAVELGGFLFILLLQVGWIDAQTADSTSTYELEDLVVTATRADLPRSEVPGQITLLTASQIHNAPSTTTDDVLRGIPAFSLFRRTSSDVGHPTTQGVNLRGIGGSGASRSLVLLDGFPLNDPFGGWVYWSRIRPRSIRRIEVLRGGGAHLWGNYALGGVIQLLTREPDGIGLSIAGGNGETWSIDGQLGKRFPTGSINFEFGHYDTGGYPVVRRDQRGAIDISASSRSTSAAIRLTKTASGGKAFNVRSGFFLEDRVNGTPLTDNRTVGGNVAATFRAPLARGQWTSRAFVQLQRFESRFSSQAGDRSIENPALDQYRVPSWATGISIEALQTFANRHLFTFGVDGRVHSGETNERFRFLDGAFIREREAGGEQWLVGGYIQDAIDLNDRVRLTLGTRIDWWASRSGRRHERNLTDRSPFRTEDPANRSTGTFSPKGALHLRLAKDVRAWTSLYRTFRGPTINELYRPFRVRNDITEASASLEIERLIGWETGLRYEGREASLQGSIFWNRVSDLILNRRIGDGPGVVSPCGFVPGGGSCSQRYNIDRVNVRGIELEASLRLAGSLTMSGAYTFSHGRIARAQFDPGLEGNRLPQVPDHRISVGLWGRADRLHGVLRLRWTGSQFEDQMNTRSLSSYATLEGSIAFRLSPFIEATLQAENLLDRTYSVGLNAAGLETIGKPRRVTLGIHFIKEN